MVAADKPIVMRILQATPEFKHHEIVVAEEVIDDYLSNPSGSGYFGLVAEVESVIKGYITFGPTPLTQGTWDIYWMAVVRETQRMGIGKALLDAAEGQILKAKGRLVLIETSSSPEYDKARGFYSAQGYVTACQINDFYSPGDSLIVFQKKFR